MTRIKNGLREPIFTLFLAFGGFGTSTVAAQDAITACVMCTQPDRSYACEVLPPETGEMAQSPQLFCAAELAKANDHTSCAVVRSANSACTGGGLAPERVTLAYTGPVTENLVEPDDAALDPPGQPEDASDAPPKTLIEATDRAVTSTGKQLKKAGDAIGDTVDATGRKVGDVTKKTGEKITETGTSIGRTVTDAAKSGWNCVVSLFQSC